MAARKRVPKKPHKLTEESVREMRALYLEGVTMRELSERFGVSHGHVSNTLRGESWGHVPGAIEGDLRRCGEDSPRHKLTVNEVMEIRRAAANGAYRSVLARRYGVSAVTIRSIELRLAWKHVP